MLVKSKWIDSVAKALAQWNANLLQGRALSAAAPTVGQDLIWSGTSWVPSGTSQSLAFCTPGAQVQGATYARIAVFRYMGSSLIGAPATIKSILNVTSGGDIRVQDTTNNLTICQKLANANTAELLVDLGALANIPAAAAIWEVQARSTGGGTNKIFVPYFEVNFS